MKNLIPIKTLFFLFLFFISITGLTQNQAFFEKGKESYKNGNFQEAITSWNQILKNGEHSAAVYFNLGNAHYKLNNIAHSIYFYEKALQLNPTDGDVKNNLGFAENARIDAIEPLPQTIFSKWYSAVSGIFTFNGWAILSVIFAFLFTGFFLAYYFSNSVKRKRLYFSISIISILVTAVTFSMAFVTFNYFKNNESAIIFAKEIAIKNEPNLGSNSAFLLHEGTKVQIIARENNWVRIKLADGKDGWIPASDLKEL